MKATDLHELKQINFIYKQLKFKAESPTMSVSGMSGKLSLNTGQAYSPAGRDTNTIYNYAESGGLIGNDGFWAKTEADVQKNINESFGKRFK